MNDAAPKLLIVLTEEKDPHRIATDLRSFLDFSNQISDSLDDLVGRWRTMAAPASALASIGRNADGRSSYSDNAPASDSREGLA